MTIDARTLKAISFPLEQGGTGQSVSGSDLFRPDSELNAEFRDRAPWWGGDLQTLRNHFLRRHVPLPSQSSTIEFPTSDGSGDRLTGTLEEPLAPAATSPLILLIHGLAGCEDSTYVRESARFHLARGRPVLRLNLRGAGTSRHLANGHYHAGSASDIQDVLNGLDYDSDQHAVFLVGFSLGGNILLNLLGRLKSQRRLIGAATVSAPIEPLDACKRIMEPRNALYHRFLLKRMKQDVLASAALSDRERQKIQRANSVYAFDDQWVAPRNGFHDAQDYYERTAGARLVGEITTPTLMLHASNDPWIPAQPYLVWKERALRHVEILLARSGGHVGFHERGRADTWHDRMIDAFIHRQPSKIEDLNGLNLAARYH
jgi:predicted alpha/beta-fold hydrolase